MGREILLFAKAKQSKNFYMVALRANFILFGYLATLRYAQYDEVGRGFALRVYFVDCHENPTDFLAMTKKRGLLRFGVAESRNDEAGRIVSANLRFVSQ